MELLRSPQLPHFTYQFVLVYDPVSGAGQSRRRELGHSLVSPWKEIHSRHRIFILAIKWGRDYTQIPAKRPAKLLIFVTLSSLAIVILMCALLSLSRIFVELFWRYFPRFLYQPRRESTRSLRIRNQLSRDRKPDFLQKVYLLNQVRDPHTIMVLSISNI